MNIFKLALIGIALILSLGFVLESAEASYFQQYSGAQSFRPYQENTNFFGNAQFTNDFAGSRGFQDQFNQFSNRQSFNQAQAGFDFNDLFVDTNDFSNLMNSGSNFQSGSNSFNLGAGDVPTFTEIVRFDIDDEDLTISRQIFGGPQISTNQDFSRSNDFANGQGFNRNLQGRNTGFNSNFNTQSANVNNFEQNRNINSFARQAQTIDTSFGRGSRVVFN